MKLRYSMLIQWSDRRKFYLATLPEFAGVVEQPCTGGYSPEEAVENAEKKMKLLIDICRQDGIPLPEPDVVNLDRELGLEEDREVA